jgi:hypothetical protein
LHLHSLLELFGGVKYLLTKLVKIIVLSETLYLNSLERKIMNKYVYNERMTNLFQYHKPLVLKNNNVPLKLRKFIIKYDLDSGEKENIIEFLKKNKINDHFNNLKDKNKLGVPHFKEYTKNLFFHIFKTNKLVQKAVYNLVEYIDDEIIYHFSNQMNILKHYVNYLVANKKKGLYFV